MAEDSGIATDTARRIFGFGALRGGTFLLTASFLGMRQNPYDWPHVGGFVVLWLVISVVAGIGLLALFDPGSIDLLVATEL